MLQIRNLTITHKKDLRVILEDFNMVLNDGDKAVVIGEEGNGKSTLMRWIYDPASVEDYTECRGTLVAGNERLGYLPQELSPEEAELPVFAFFEKAEGFYQQTPKDLALLAKRFHVTPAFFYAGQSMGSLSGGEKVKAQLMRLLMQEPTVLLLDEPSNDIDIPTLEMLEKLILDWKHIVLYVSHDETLIEHTANRIIHFEQIRRKTQSRYTIVEMPYKEYIRNRKEQFDRQMQLAANDEKAKKERDEKYRRVLQSVEHALGSVSRQSPAEAKNLKDKMHAVKSMGKRFEREDEEMTSRPDAEEAIFFKLGDAASAIPAGKTVLEISIPELEIPDPEEAGGKRSLAGNIYLKIRGPEKVCIIGKNGAGKTTLLKRIAAELFARDDIHAEYMPQNYEDLLKPDQTPVDYLDQSGDKAERTKIRTFLGALKYTADEMDHPIRELSGGQKAKVLLLKMSLSGANVLILDEPTRNFSPLSGPVIRRMIREFPGAVISVSHDRKYISEVCGKVYELTETGLLRRDDQPDPD